MGNISFIRDLFTKPIVCNYYLTLRCNSRCEFCNIWREPDNFNLKEQSLEEIDNNLRDLKRLGTKLIDFTGGEPLLSPHIVEALRLAKKYGFYTSITINCSLYPRYASELKGIVDILQFSFESADEIKHNNIRGLDSYKSVIESILIARQIKQEFNLMHTVTDENAEYIPTMVNFAHKNNCLLILSPCFEYFGNEQISRETAMKVKRHFKESHVAMDLAYLKFIERGGNDINSPVCRAVSSNIVISPDNFLLLPCYHRAIEKIKINNNLFEIYNSDKVKKLAEKEGKFTFCKNCTIYCYMRTALFKKYPYLSLKSVLKYWRTTRFKD